jgi:hypothetical protein
MPFLEQGELFMSGFDLKMFFISRKGAKTQSAAAFLNGFLSDAPLRLCGRNSFVDGLLRQGIHEQTVD